MNIRRACDGVLNDAVSSDKETCEPPQTDRRYQGEVMAVGTGKSTGRDVVDFHVSIGNRILLTSTAYRDTE